jgi:hypothetical protein
MYIYRFRKLLQFGILLANLLAKGIVSKPLIEIAKLLQKVFRRPDVEK